MPTFVIIPAAIKNGSIEVDIPGRASKRANIGADEWINGKVDIDDTRLRATVDDIEVLSLTETKGAPVAGDIGLFVDIGSESFFSNLKITPR